MKRLPVIFVFLLAVLAGVSCSVTRKLPEESYLVQKVTVEADKETPKKERIPASDLRKFIRQNPNKRFLGLNFYVWVYEQADPEKDNWWNRFKRRIGEAPVLLDMSLTEQSVRNLKVYMDYRGFFSSQATYEVDTTSRKKRAFITYRTVQREPYRINRLSYDFRDRFLEQIILPDTVHSLLRTGEVFDMEVLDQERQRITTYLKQRGYYNFTVNNIEYEADTLGGNHLVDLKMIVKQHLAGYNEQGYPILRNNTVYRIDQINIFPNYDPTAAIAPDYRKGLDTIYYRGLNVVYHKDNKRPNIRPSVLRQIVPIYPNYVYNINRVDQTYNQIMSMGYFKSANVIFNEQADSVAKDNYVTFVGEGKEPADSVHQTREGYLQCDIQCIPALKQGYKIELEGSTTSSFYGLRATVGYQNRNIFRGAESFDVSFSVGYEYMKTPSARKRNAIEFGVNMGLQFPRFLLPFRTQRWQSIQMPRTRLEFGINFQDRPYYRRTLSSVAWGYSWSDLKYSSYSLRPIDINVIDMGYVNRKDFLDHLQNEYLKRSYESQFISGLSFSYVYNNQRKHLGGNATLLRFNYEMAGNLLDGLMHLFSRPAAGKDYYEVFGLQYSQYFRADLSVSRKIMLGDGSRGTALRRLRYGVRQFDFDSLRPSVLCGRCQQHARLGTPYVGAGGCSGAGRCGFPYTTGRYEAGGQSRIALPDLGDVSRSDVRRCGQYLVCRPAFRAFARCGFPFRQFLQATGLRCRYRSAPGHQICRTASGLGHTDPQPQCTCRTTVDPQFQVEEYGA